jgi:hypothetical protein
VIQLMGGRMLGARRLAVLIWVAAAPALAQEESEPTGIRPVASLGFGYTIPFGHLSNTDTLDVNATMKGGFPIHLELGVAFARRWHLVAYGEYSFLDRSQRCVQDVDCPGRLLRVGGQVQYWAKTFDGQQAFLGLGGGWEQLTLSFNSDSLLWSGFEGVFTAGVMFRLASWFWVGPYTSISIGGFSRLVANIGGEAGEETIRNQSLHCWWVLGLRFDVTP